MFKWSATNSIPMTVLQALDIVLSDQMAIYFPGQTVEGVIIVHISEAMKMRSIKASILGYSYTAIEDPGGLRLGVLFTREKEKHLDETMVVWGDANGSEDVLAAGKYNFNFQFKLPNDAQLPSSFEYRTSHIRYEIMATIDRPWKSDHLSKRAFTFLQIIDVNKPPLSQPLPPKEAETSICCLCCTSGPITLKASIDRSGYCPGESISLKTECINNTNTDMEGIQVRLYRIDSRTVPGRTIIHNEIYSKLCSDPIKELQNFTWNPAITVPVVAPTINTSKSITVSYELQVSLTVLSGNTLELKIPITIGTIPLHVAAPNIANPSPGQSPPDVPPSYDAIHEAVSYDYMECVDGPYELKEIDSREYVTYKLSFAPLYPCVKSSLQANNSPVTNQPTTTHVDDVAISTNQ
ncbi:Arrestin domain-containing protein 3 [Trichoplax sp. H2]|nr:Arrestin domain-containing protein 3 [Trichoplax sp. H2]|eukprot:RDD41414.1 Arrestin domain-containing protein 3 [Trichoplax sp. H2]